MGYLYLNFMDNLERGSKSWDDFYTTSLKDQYEGLKPRLGIYAADTFQEFMASAFPFVEKYYNISLPGFDRRIRKKTTKNEKTIQYINNVVIRPETRTWCYIIYRT